MAIYKGFSTYNRIKKFRVSDFDLVKQDIINHFNIRKGEKLMNPDFGTILWNLLFEPLTDDVRQLVAEDVKRICSYDPRVVLDMLTINTYQNGISIMLDLTYITEDQKDTLVLTFDNQQNRVLLGTSAKAAVQ